ncbi:hypothetical protein PGB90_005342 [Kerria lacca]
MWSFGSFLFQYFYLQLPLMLLYLVLPYCFVGCILAELYTGYPLFPGENEVEQLACIMEIIGLPPYEVLMRAARRKLFFSKVTLYMYT